MKYINSCGERDSGYAFSTQPCIATLFPAMLDKNM